MNKESLESISEQLDSMQGSFEDLQDACYHLRLIIDKEIKNNALDDCTK